MPIPEFSAREIGIETWFTEAGSCGPGIGEVNATGVKHLEADLTRGHKVTARLIYSNTFVEGHGFRSTSPCGSPQAVYADPESLSDVLAPYC